MAPAIVVVGREEGEVRSGSYKRRERPQVVGGGADLPDWGRS